MFEPLCARIDLSWQRNWPFPRGAWLFNRFQNILHRCGILHAVVKTVPPGVIMELDSRDFVTATILADGYWESETADILETYLAPGSVFIDCGSHVGYFSILASRLVGVNGRVVTIEANPSTASRFKRNRELNGLANVTLFECACSSEEGTVTFHCAESANPGGSSLAATNAGPHAQRVTVPAYPLDTLVRQAQLTRIDLVKIDAEGAELLVLEGFATALAQFNPVLVLELKEDLLQTFGTSVAGVTSWLGELGYSKHVDIDAFGNSVWRVEAAVMRASAG